MTTPHLPGPPDGSFVLGSNFGQDITETSAKAIMKGGTVSSYENAQEVHHSNVSIDSPMWKTLDGNEESTFPRANLNYGASGGTSSGGSGDSSHTHNLGRVPDYQPGGNYLELGFIKVQTHCTLNAVGFITGDSETWLGVVAAHTTVYKMDDTTGNLTQVYVSGDIQSSVTAKNTETRIQLPTPINARQGDTYAVGILTRTSGLQKPGSLMCTTITDINRGTITGTFPRRLYGYAGTYSAPPPASITESSINYSSSTKLPFFFLRRA